MTGTREKVAYCFANLAAALFALYVAFWLDLDRPYWAVFSVFIVSKPISGAVRAKGVYRFAGTFVGASMSVFLVPPLVQAPVLLCLAVSLWIGLCLYFALQDRTPRSYAFLLAGYSVAIVGFSAVNAPTTVFDVAVSRLEEITIGIVCASVAHSVFFPRSIADAIQGKAEEAIRLAAQAARKSVGLNPIPPSTAGIAALAAAVTDLDALYAQIGLETSNVPRLRSVMIALLDRLAAVLPQASIVCRSVAALKREGGIPPRLRSTLSRVSSMLSSFPHGGSLGGISFKGPQSTAFESAHRGAGPEATALEALAERYATTLATTLLEARELAAALTGTGAAAGAANLVSEEVRRPFYRDRALALLSAASATAATLVACALWIETSWPEGFVAAQFAAICCSLFATADAPSKQTFAAVLGIAVALPAAAVYEFAVLPGIDGFPSLALVLTPALLLFSYLQTFERLEGAALVLAVAFSGALALQESFVSDFASFVNANLAEMVGPLIAAGMLLVFRTIDPVWNARRILNSGWAVVSETARKRTIDPANALLPLFDRAGQAALRLAAREPNAPEEDILLDLRVLLNIAGLRQAGSALGNGSSRRIDETLWQVGNLGLDRREDRGVLGRNLSTAFDRLSATLNRLPPSGERTEGMTAVMGLRLDLDPHLRGSTVPP
jgi:uncharacterized membrane protein YccC